MLVPQQEGYPCSPHCAGYLRELEQRKEVERLRAAAQVAHGALLCIAGTDSNWAEYARKVADEVGATIDPAAYQQPQEKP